MAFPSRRIQMINLHYRGKGLTVLDSDNRTPIYDLEISRSTPQLRLTPLAPSNAHADYKGISTCTATFKALSMQVQLELHGRQVTMCRPNSFTRAYGFDSPSLGGQTLHWEPDGVLSGDFRLVDPKGPPSEALVRYHNKFLSNTTLGSFEIIGEMDDRMRDEAVITGLAELVMVQSIGLAGLILFGPSGLA